MTVSVDATWADREGLEERASTGGADSIPCGVNEQLILGESESA
jgi:hypothetical protein